MVWKSISIFKPGRVDEMLAETIISNMAEKVPLVFPPTMPADRHCLFQVTLGSEGAEHITLSLPALLKPPALCPLPTVQFASRTSKLEKCTRIRRSTRHFRSQARNPCTICNSSPSHQALWEAFVERKQSCSSGNSGHTSAKRCLGHFRSIQGNGVYFISPTT